MNSFEISESNPYSNYACSYLLPFMKQVRKKNNNGMECSWEDLPKIKANCKASVERNSLPELNFCKSILWIMVKKQAWLLTIIFICEILIILLSILQPYLYRGFFEYFESEQGEFAKGLGYVLGIIAVQHAPNFVGFFKNQVVWIAANRAKTKVTTSLIEKIALVDPTELEQFGNSEIFNALSHTSCINIFMTSLSDYWATPVRLLVTFGLLVREVGWSFVLCLLFGIATLWLNWTSASKLLMEEERFSEEANENKKVTDECLRGVKAIKQNAWEAFFTKRVEEAFEKTRLTGNRIRKIIELDEAQKRLFSHLILFVVVFCFWTEAHLTVGKAMVLLELHSQFTYPLFHLTTLYSDLTNILINSKIIEKVFSLSERISQCSRNLFPGTISLNQFVTPLLKQINLNIHSGETIGLCGTVGSGKSLLLNGILGEIKAESGEALYGGSVNYLSHDPWILSASLQENIIMGAELDEMRYRRVLRLCGLEKDITQLPFQDQTYIGSRGINLSGGQRNRVGLARALYNESDIYLIDDIFSQLDRDVATYIFENAILQHLKNRTGANPMFLEKADKVIYMDNGSISYEGSFEKLPVDILLFETKPEKKEIEKEEEKEEEPNTEESLLKQNKEISFWDGLKGLIFYSSKPALIFFVIFFLAQIGVDKIKGSWLYSWSYNDYGLSETTYLWMFGILGLASAGVNLLLSRSKNIFTSTFFSRLHKTMAKKVLNAPLQWHSETENGRISFNLTNSFGAYLDLILSIKNFLINLGFIVVFSLFIISYFPFYIFYLIIFVITIQYLRKYYQPFLTQALLMWNEAEQNNFSRKDEYLEGLPVIRYSERLQEFAKNRIFEQMDKVVASSQATIYSDKWMYIRWRYVDMFVMGIVLLQCFALRGFYSPAIFALLFHYTVVIGEDLEGMFFSVADVITYMLSFRRVLEFMESIPEEAVRSLPPPSWPTKGNIEIRGVNLQYKEEFPVVVRDLNLSILHGEKVGIMGRTGSGKSTLMLALLQIIRQKMNHKNQYIKIDNIDIDQINVESLRKALAIIPQEPYVFEGTLQSNIDPNSQYSTSDIMLIMERLGLDKLLNKQLNDKTGTITGLFIQENGANLSQGEKQLVCIARALIRKPKILLMDEATAGLDEESDLAVKALLSSPMFSDTTMLMIAHKLNSLSLCKRIIRIEGGICVEQS